MVRIEATNVTINGTLTADGGTGGTYDGGGAGGSIWISCASFGGGTSGVVRARGGTGGYGYVTDTSGGGGRIAIIYSSLIGTPGAQFSVAPGSNYTYPAEYGTLYLPDTALVTQPFNNFQGVRLVIPGFNSLNADSLVVSNSIVSFGDGDFILTVTNNLTIWSNSWLALGGVMYGGTQALKSVTVTATNPIVRVGGNVLLDRGGLTLGGANQLSHVFMTVGTNLSITGGGILKLGGNLQTAFSALTVGGNLVVTNNGQLHVYCGISNAVKRYGGRVAVSGSTSIAGGGWIFPYSHQTNGAAVLFDLKDLLVGTSSGFNADNNGFAWIGATCYAPSYGATYGSRGAGSGHGGAGGSITLAAGGRPYGSTNAPLLPGAPGGYGYGNPSGFAQPGGGVVQIHAGNITLNGQVKASQTLANSYGGGGGGGGIFITCDTFNGASTGVLRADGGNGGTSGNPQGGGGGGRISLAIGFSDTNIEKLILGQPVAGLAEVPSHGTYLGIFSVTNGVGNGTGNPGTLGTVRILKIRYPGTLIDLR